MRKCLWILMMVAFPGLASIAAQTTTPSYDNLYVFGDSYCDVGNLFTATGGAEPAAPYYNGRFSNGPIWVDHVAGLLSVPLKASLLGGTDYAFGGAWVTAPQAIPGGTIPNVPEQVELYLSQHGGKADPNALYILEGGGNDILGTTTGSPEALGFQIAVGIAGSEWLLRQAGARHFVIPNLFNVGLLPAAATNADFAAAASVATNKSEDELLRFEESLEGIHILRIDVFSLLNAVETAPTHFGFTDITDPCLTTSVCSDPDHTFFWDTHHPTEFGHAFFAVTLENALPKHRD
ncbi:MAG: SGNH/GDSL hydrolase family protein [Terracidiphilus sp.]|jgi:outer membrane lipase/esterase